MCRSSMGEMLSNLCGGNSVMRRGIILSEADVILSEAKDLPRFGQILRSLRSLRMTDRGTI